MSFTASARQVAGGLRHEVDVNGRHVIVTDEPRALGGTDVGPAPHELMPAMIASCVSTTLAMYASRHGWELGELQVDVTYEPASSPSSVELAIHLPPGLTEAQAARLRRVAAACPVRRALEGEFAFREALSSDPPAAAAAA